MEIMKTRSSWAKDLGLSDDFIRQFLEQLHKESIRTQTKIMNTSGKENIN
jgi:chorismate mutase